MRNALAAGRRRRAPGLERGSAVAEFCLVMVVLVPLFLGVIHVGFVVHVRNTLAAAAADGARVASRADVPASAGAARAREQISRALDGRYAQDVHVSQATDHGVPIVRVTVTARVPALGVLGPAVRVRCAARAVREGV